MSKLKYFSSSSGYDSNSNASLSIDSDNYYGKPYNEFSENSLDESVYTYLKKNKKSVTTKHFKKNSKKTENNKSKQEFEFDDKSESNRGFSEKQYNELNNDSYIDRNETRNTSFLKNKNAKLFKNQNNKTNIKFPRYKFEEISEGDQDLVTDWMINKFKPSKDVIHMELNDIFQNLLTEEFLQKICDYSLNYYRETIIKISGGRKTPGQYDNFHPTPKYLRKYLALIIFMGLDRAGDCRIHFSLFTPMFNPFANMQMSRKEFDCMTKFIHFSETTEISDDPLHKVRYPLNYFSNVWKKFYIPCEHLSLDETMIAFNGKVNFRCFVPRKPNPHGMKAFTLATSPQGYIINWEIFTRHQPNESDEAESPIERIVFKLLEGFEHSGVKVFTDNYFTSMSLLEKLEKKGIGLTGTLRPNRRITNEHIPKHFKKNDAVIAKKCGNAILTCWMDGIKQVPLLTNVYGHKSIMHTRYSKRSSRTWEASMPLVVRMYSRYTHGVDTANAIASHYRFKHKSVKWYKYLFFYAFEVTIVNAFIFYKNMERLKGNTQKRFSAVKFRIKLIEYLTEWYRPLIHSKKSSKSEVDNYVIYHKCEKCKNDNKKNCFALIRTTIDKIDFSKEARGKWKPRIWKKRPPRNIYGGNKMIRLSSKKKKTIFGFKNKKDKDETKSKTKMIEHSVTDRNININIIDGELENEIYNNEKSNIKFDQNFDKKIFMIEKVFKTDMKFQNHIIPQKKYYTSDKIDLNPSYIHIELSDDD